MRPEKAKRKQFVRLLTLRYFCVSDSLLVGVLPLDDSSGWDVISRAQGGSARFTGYLSRQNDFEAWPFAR